MVIVYNRVAHRGDYVEYPVGKGTIKRLAFGRHGIGRHAMFCFDDTYIIDTCKNGKRNTYEIADAVLDRIINNSYEIVIKGKDSMRKMVITKFRGEALWTPKKCIFLSKLSNLEV